MFVKARASVLPRGIRPWLMGLFRVASRSGVLPWLIALPAASMLVCAAIGRQLSLEAISPTDLAFFHQSTWSAAHGLGFAQTVLGFESGDLLHGVHLEPLRLALAALYRLAPGLATLVGVQALAVALGGVAAWWLVFDGTGSRGAASLATVACLAHPLTLELACADLRPIVFMAPGALVVLLAVSRRRVVGTVLGGLMVLAAREEGPKLLSVLLPFAVLEGWRRPADRRALVALVLVAGAGYLMFWLMWGRVGNIDPFQEAGTIAGAIVRGERPLFRNAGEAWFGLKCVAPCVLGLLAPELLLPAVAVWGLLAVFSSYEAVNAGGRGVHYLAVVYPLLLGAAVVGLVRLGRWMGVGREERGRARAEAAVVLFAGLMALAALAVDGPQRAMVARFAGATGMAAPGEAVALRRLLEPVMADEGAVLSAPACAPWLAGRRVLRVVGEFAATPETVASVVEEVRWAVIEAREGALGGAMGDEATRWQRAVEESGFQRLGEAMGLAVWERRRAPVPRVEAR